jgi:hypothetical protein
MINQTLKLLIKLSICFNLLSITYAATTSNNLIKNGGFELLNNSSSAVDLQSESKKVDSSNTINDWNMIGGSPGKYVFVIGEAFTVSDSNATMPTGRVGNNVELKYGKISQNINIAKQGFYKYSFKHAIRDVRNKVELELKLGDATLVMVNNLGTKEYSTCSGVVKINSLGEQAFSFEAKALAWSGLPGIVIDDVEFYETDEQSASLDCEGGVASRNVGEYQLDSHPGYPYDVCFDGDIPDKNTVNTTPLACSQACDSTDGCVGFAFNYGNGACLQRTYEQLNFCISGGAQGAGKWVQYEKPPATTEIKIGEKCLQHSGYLTYQQNLQLTVAECDGSSKQKFIYAANFILMPDENNGKHYCVSAFSGSNATTDYTGVYPYTLDALCNKNDVNLRFIVDNSSGIVTRKDNVGYKLAENTNDGNKAWFVPVMSFIASIGSDITAASPVKVGNECLQHAGPDNQNGTRLTVAECNGSDNQQFIYKNNFIVVADSSSKCISGFGGSLARTDYTDVSPYLWDCNRDDINMKFVVNDNGIVTRMDNPNYKFAKNPSNNEAVFKPVALVGVLDSLATFQYGDNKKLYLLIDNNHVMPFKNDVEYIIEGNAVDLADVMDKNTRDTTMYNGYNYIGCMTIGNGLKCVADMATDCWKIELDKDFNVTKVTVDSDPQKTVCDAEKDNFEFSGVLSAIQIGTDGTECLQHAGANNENGDLLTVAACNPSLVSQKFIYTKPRGFIITPDGTKCISAFSGNWDRTDYTRVRPYLFDCIQGDYNMEFNVDFEGTVTRSDNVDYKLGKNANNEAVFVAK